MSVIDSAIDRIRELILSGELAPGDRLPAEPELAALVGVSRNSLREAVRALAQAKVLDVRRGDGTYVTSLEPRLLLGGMAFVTDLLQERTLLEVFEVRRLLEPAATGLAAVRIDDETVAELRADLDRMERASDVEELVELDIEFHRRIVHAAGNATLESILDALASRALRARIWRGISGKSAEGWTLAQHALIVEALANRNVVFATAASTVHVTASEQWLRHVLELDATGNSSPVMTGGLSFPADPDARADPDAHIDSPPSTGNTTPVT
jgi:DNA-binding FadR family transcriptional regulator